MWRSTTTGPQGTVGSDVKRHGDVGVGHPGENGWGRSGDWNAGEGLGMDQKLVVDPQQNPNPRPRVTALR